MSVLRHATIEDRDGIVALINSVLGEYGDRLVLETLDCDLLDIEGYYFARGGAFVVLDENGRIRGTHAAVPKIGQPGICEFKRLYLEASWRGGVWGTRLMQWSIDWAQSQGMRRIEFWSDTRFVRAHRFFARFGFQHDGRIRTVPEGWTPYQEFFYFLDL